MDGVLAEPRTGGDVQAVAAMCASIVTCNMFIVARRCPTAAVGCKLANPIYGGREGGGREVREELKLSVHCFGK